MFTRSGSKDVWTRFPAELRGCLYTWRERRLKMATLQQTEVWAEIGAGLVAFEYAIDVFADAGDGRVVEEALDKPVDLSDLAALYGRHVTSRWAFAIASLTFTRAERGGPSRSVRAPAKGGKPKPVTAAHALAIFDLRNRDLAGVCFVPTCEEQPLVAMILAAEKLLDAFRKDHGRMHV